MDDTHGHRWAPGVEGARGAPWRGEDRRELDEHPEVASGPGHGRAREQERETRVGEYFVGRTFEHLGEQIGGKTQEEQLAPRVGAWTYFARHPALCAPSRPHHSPGSSSSTGSPMAASSSSEQPITVGTLTPDDVYEEDYPADYDDDEDFDDDEDEYLDGEARHHRTAKLLISGGIAGVISRSATAPLDRLKMLLQVNDAERRMTMKEGLRIMAKEGTVKSFFKGNGTNVVKIAPETAIKLTMNDIYKRIIATDVESITPPQRMAAGALAGATSQVIIYPLELVKTRLAVCPAGTYKGIIDCARKVLKQEGVRSFYRGLLPSMMGILPYAGVDITVFEMLKERLLDEYDGMPPPHSILGAGMLSSSIAQFSAYPLALVRTRLQAQGIGGQKLKYNGMLDVLRKTYEREGWRGLYKGSMTNLAKLAPAAGISWFVFEESKTLLGVDGTTKR